MIMKIIDCLKVRDEMLKEAKDLVNTIEDVTGIVPNLAVIQVGDDPASTTYIRNKIKTCDMVGIKSNVFKLPDYSSNVDIERYIDLCNHSSQCDAILLQLPLPTHLKSYEQQLVELISPDKDVDGLTSTNIGKLWSGMDCITPCTPTGILRLLGDDLSGKVVTILGRSKLVGMPLIKLLQDRNATVISCHSRTGAGNMDLALQNSDILISAIGQPKWVKAWDLQVHDENGMHMRCKTVIDVGINRDSNGKLCGDVDMKTFEGSDVNITPVPRGVGILTTAQLMLNTIKCFDMQRNIF